MSSLFSERYEIPKESPEITIRYGDPGNLRYAVTLIVYESGFYSQDLRDIVCETLKELPKNNSKDEYFKEEVQDLLVNCEWYYIYDVIEKVYDAAQFRVTRDGVNAAEYIEREINKYFREHGIGWELIDGRIQYRGEDSFQHIVDEASNALEEKGLGTSHKELRLAIQALSLLPEPDPGGAIVHGTKALEAVARIVAEDDKPTLGRLVQKHPGLFPEPLDISVEKMWGYASDWARHGKEGRVAPLAEAQLVVGISSALCMYLTHKIGNYGG